jgi:FAD/FMN-containing dehydrogenase
MSFTMHVNHKHAGRRRQGADGRVSSAYQEHLDLRRDELADALSSRIRGEVRFDAGSRALYATDASNYRQVPIGVVIPRSIEDVIETIAVCRRFDAPIVARGGGTSLAGQGCNVAILIDFSKYLHGLLAIDGERGTAEVEPGCVLDVLRTAANAHGLTFGPDPATHDRNTLGGMIGNNSCGVHSVVAGRTSDNVESLEIVTYDGLRMVVGPTSEQDFRRHISAGGRRAEIFGRLDEFRNHYRELILAKYPHIPRRVSGYENLDRLLPEHGFNVAQALVGTEGTCVTVLRATVKLIPNPQHRVLAILGFDDIVAAAMDGSWRSLRATTQRTRWRPRSARVNISSGKGARPESCSSRRRRRNSGTSARPRSQRRRTFRIKRKLTLVGRTVPFDARTSGSTSAI